MYLAVSRVFVLHPSANGLSPVLDSERLGELLSLTVAPPALRLGPRDQMVFVQIDLQVFSDFAADLRFRAPRAAVLLLTDPETGRTTVQSTVQTNELRTMFTKFIYIRTDVYLLAHEDGKLDIRR